MRVLPGRFLAYVSGFGPWKRLNVGQQFMELPADEQLAVVMHEISHCKRFHIEKRALWLLLGGWLAPGLLRAACASQELDADSDVGRDGYAVQLARVVCRFASEHRDGSWHPNPALRLENLKRFV